MDSETTRLLEAELGVMLDNSSNTQTTTQHTEPSAQDPREEAAPRQVASSSQSTQQQQQQQQQTTGKEDGPPTINEAAQNELRRKILAIQNDNSLSPMDKAKKIQASSI
jgi:hypothetical protein